ncbi:MAG: glycerol-3-phosphate 1-O-acyltransferase PlsB [Gammaproteobacteria bacterium]|nr:glycerol-3-phosphate 1-O-acyltransferase PlsB [Gammaproteobacteria bacterium]
MSFWLGLDRIGLALARALTAACVRPTVQPADYDPARIDAGLPLFYVLENSGLADRQALELLCRQRGMPGPNRAVRAPGLNERRAVLYLRHLQGMVFRRPSRQLSDRLARLVSALKQDPGLEVQIVPVAIFWGRAPGREASWLKLLLAENWNVGGRLRKLLVVLLNGREAVFHVGTPLRMRRIVDEEPDAARAVRKIARVLRAHFRRQRAATIGPDLSHRRTLVSQILGSEPVRREIEETLRREKISTSQATARARRYAHEIAADYSPSFVRVMERVLGWLWNRLYDGIELGHGSNLPELAKGNELVYVPSHRSHIDYLLLPYILYHKGLVVPHVAAGINLDLPFVGRFLRRGGAFFLRRSFKGNRLYSSVFEQYLAFNLRKGFPIEYYVEGGRSRTGRLLQPKPGLLAMTAVSYQEKPRRPIVFVPVYFGYEKLVEGPAFLDELGGRPKRKETLRGALRSIRALRGRFGKVYVNIGQPIYLAQVLTEQSSGRRRNGNGEDRRPEWLSGVVAELARRIMTGINSAAAVGPVNLLAMILLATPRRAMPEQALIQQIELSVALLRKAPYSPLVTITRLSGAEIIDHGASLGMLSRRPHPLGDVIALQGEHAALMAYFRNNVLHLFALPSLIACCFRNAPMLTPARLLELARLAWPYMRAELFLRWSDDELERAMQRVIRVFVDRGLLEHQADEDHLIRPGSGTHGASQLTVLAHGALEMLERFYMTIALLLSHGSGRLTRDDLEHQCRLTAEHLSLLYEADAPEFFEPSLFSNFIDRLLERGVVWITEDGRLGYDDSLHAVDDDARLVLSDPVRRSIQQATRGTERNEPALPHAATAGR